MQTTLEEDDDHDVEGDAESQGGGDSVDEEVQKDVGGEIAKKLDEPKKEKILAELRVEIAALKGETPSPSTIEKSQKGVVRNVLAFKVWEHGDCEKLKMHPTRN